jgi:hypothetical protein
MDVAFIAVTVTVDHRDLDAVDEANREDAHLAIILTIVGPFDGWSVKDARRVPKCDPMPADIDGILRWIPREPHPGLLRNVFTHVEM